MPLTYIPAPIPANRVEPSGHSKSEILSWVKTQLVQLLNESMPRELTTGWMETMLGILSDRFKWAIHQGFVHQTVRFDVYSSGPIQAGALGVTQSVWFNVRVSSPWFDGTIVTAELVAPGSPLVDPVPPAEEAPEVITPEETPQVKDLAPLGSPLAKRIWE